MGQLAVWVEDHPEAFEVDGVDQSTGIAWRVNLKGAAELLTSTEELVESFSLMLFPWESGHKYAFVRITPASTTGRRFRVSEPTEWWTINSRPARAADEQALPPEAGPVALEGPAGFQQGFQ